MENTIVVFTNYASLNNVESNLRQQRGIPLITSNNAIGFNEASGMFEPARALNDAYRIYFVRDTMPQNEFDAFVGPNRKESIHVLRHRLPKLKFDGFPASNLLKGAHDSTGPFYDQALRIITDARPDKFKRLFAALFAYDHVLELKLGLLDEILSGEKSLTEVIDTLADDEPEKVRRLYDPLFTDDPELGQRLLRPVETYRGRKVTLEEKLDLLKDEFSQLTENDVTDMFSPGYLMAFDKLRGALGLD